MSWEQIQPYLQHNAGAPPGFTSLAGGAGGAAIEEFYNPTTGQTYMAPYLGMTPGPGWISGTPPAGTQTTPWTGGNMAMPSYPRQFPGNTGYTNGQWNPNFMTGFPMNNMLPVNKFQRGMPPPIPGTLPVLQPTVGPTTTTPTVGTLPPDPDDPNNMRGGTEGAEAHMDRVRQMSEDFYRNNPDHWMSKIDAKLRKMMGMPPLSRTTMFPFRKSPQETARVRRAMADKQAEIMARGGERDVPEGGFSPGAAIDVSQDTGNKPF